MIKKSILSISLGFGLSISAATTTQTVINNYADLVYSTYSDSLDRAVVLQEDVEFFISNPGVMTLEMARESWKQARAPYGQSEVFRFYNGPIDSDQGPEGLLNAWPLDEAYIDYVEGAPNAGIVNNVADYPVITKDLLSSLNELNGEKNISTGYHAIEFLLWGQDLSATGPGNRSYTDYVIGLGQNAQRRATYLSVATDLLIDHLQTLVDAWEPNKNNYRAEFVAKNQKEALNNILAGMIYMSGDELSGERMFVAWETMGQEDEHSCFSDMTHMDIQWNFWGVANILKATGILGLTENTVLSDAINTRVAKINKMLAGLPVPFDQAILDENARVDILASIEEMEELAIELVELSEELETPVQW
ncbi:imelysin family protein [Halobacteriovorax sp. DPLXC-1]|uniref:imelysin family protein n=1 Tax=Halobacteriovorax sp. DPLXC-1 TaxID=3110771 RepID=UPI002FF15D99